MYFLVAKNVRFLLLFPLFSKIPKRFCLRSEQKETYRFLFRSFIKLPNRYVQP